MKCRVLLVTCAVLLKTLVGSDSEEKSLTENEYQTPENRILGFAMSSDSCSRLPETKKEKLIGVTFEMLCKHFGPKTRDRIIGSIEGTTLPSSKVDEKKILHHCLDIMMPKLMSCFQETFDNYDLAGTEEPPVCMSNITIIDEKKLQLFWLKKFPILLKFIERVIKGYKIFNPARGIVEKFLEQGIMERWKKYRMFEYAKNKTEAWRSLNMEKGERLRKILQEPPDVLDICEFSREWLRNPHDFQGNHCLRNVLGNIVVLEKILQYDGVTLESEFIGGKYLPLHLLHVVKSVLRGHSSSRRSLQWGRTPVHSAVSQVHEVRAASVKCLNELRSRFDSDNEKISHLLRNDEIVACFNNFLDKVEKLAVFFNNLHHEEFNGPVRKLVGNANKVLAKYIILSYENMDFIKVVIRDLIKYEVLESSEKYPWSLEFLKKFKSLTVMNKYAKLDNAFYAVNDKSPGKKCENTKLSKKEAKKCWKQYFAELIVIESELIKTNLSLQYVFLGDPIPMNLVYIINEELMKYENEKTRMIAGFRRKSKRKDCMDVVFLSKLAQVRENLSEELYQEFRKYDGDETSPGKNPSVKLLIEATIGVKIDGSKIEFSTSRGRIANLIFKLKKKVSQKVGPIMEKAKKGISHAKDRVKKLLKRIHGR